MKPTMILMMTGLILILSACTDETVVPQKSPCVGIDNSPCGPKRPVNGNLNDMSENVQPALNRA